MMRTVMSFLKRIMGMKAKKGKNMAGQHDEKPGGATRVLQPAYTVRLRPDPEDQIPAEAETVRAVEREGAPSEIAWAGLTDIGMVRDHNEDNFSQLNLEEESLFVVADGMGGHDAGETASKLAVEAVCREVSEGVRRNYDPKKLIEQAVQQANADVKREGKSKGSDMGTTLSVALIAGGTAYIANVGDSRAYWIENGSITQITEDHSLVAKLVAAGKLTREEARNHPKSNLLYRTIGNEETVKVDTFQVTLKKGGSLLLCTDGLWGEVADEDIHRVFASESDAKTACARLVGMANENGGKDNITAVVVKIF
jgi:serine/threonine protein phosphatase PrpC